MDIATILLQSVERYPDHTALIFEDRRWTYRAWYDRVSRFAQALADLGISDAEAQALGLRIYKVALTWPLEESGARAFAGALSQSPAAVTPSYVRRHSHACAHQ